MSVADDLVKAYNDGYAQGKADMAAELKACRNELCLICGQYRQQHLGACDGCRWLEVD